MTRPRQHVGLPAPCPVEFSVDGEQFTLPELPTRLWLDSLVLNPPGCWWQLIPYRLDGDGGDRLFRRLFDPEDRLDIDDLEHVALSVLSAVIGLDFWAACQLAGMAYGTWLLFDGWSYTRGVDPMAEPIDRVLAAVYTWRRSLCTKETELARLDADVFVTGPATTPSGRPRQAAPLSWSDEREAAAFSALVNTFGARQRGG